ncbi:caldesmon, putative [Entamoeba dispar SAW760]|uniref:Caldesmon, putative n=1 Tax=Entamoeba dispar (strain ATCC PRA-260 / SAW760) TaxID=370354 RepID=B0ER74_ENTDS|nr:caldesmon, putative [Entamoeba dispar SAW760]EDR22976.1 caldesmon, putative [Entamoeba dispar SAW760]|eukprot:EDR22976.1 caldesmon, putative [Entamoeba dispar SAW760]
MKTESIKIDKPIYQVLLQNEPILEHIEEKLGLSRGSLKFEKKQFITCKSNPEKLKLVGPHLKNEFKNYVYFTSKVECIGDANIQQLVTHYLAIQFRHPSTNDLHFCLTNENKNQSEFVIYGKKQHSIEIIKPMINKETVNGFEEYSELLNMPSLVKKNYFEIYNMIDQLHLTTIPNDFKDDDAPIVYGFRPYMKEFIRKIDQMENQMFTIIKIKTNKPIDIINKAFFDEKFHLMITNVLRTPPGYRCVFSQSGKLFTCELHVEKEFASNLVILLTGFFDSIETLILKDNMSDDDMTKYSQYIKDHTTPFNALITRKKNKKSGESQLIGCVATNRDINPEINDSWQNQLISYIKAVDLPPELAPLPPLPPKVHGKRKKALPPIPTDVPSQEQPTQSSTEELIPPPVPAPRKSKQPRLSANLTNEDVPDRSNRDRSMTVFGDQPTHIIEEEEPYYEDIYYGDSYYGDDGYYYVYDHNTKRYHVEDPPEEDYIDENQQYEEMNQNIYTEETVQEEEQNEQQDDQAITETKQPELIVEDIHGEPTYEETPSQNPEIEENIETEEQPKEEVYSEAQQEVEDYQEALQEVTEQEAQEIVKEEVISNPVTEELAQENVIEEQTQEIKDEQIQEEIEENIAEPIKEETKDSTPEELTQEKVEETAKEEIQEIVTEEPIKEEEIKENVEEDEFAVSTIDEAVVSQPSKTIDDLCEEASVQPSVARRPGRGRGGRKPPTKKLIERQKKMRTETNEKDEKNNTFKMEKVDSKENNSNNIIPPRKTLGVGMGGMGMPQVTLADLQKRKQAKPSLEQKSPHKQPTKKKEDEKENKSGLFGMLKDKKEDKKKKEEKKEEKKGLFSSSSHKDKKDESSSSIKQKKEQKEEVPPPVPSKKYNSKPSATSPSLPAKSLHSSSGAKTIEKPKENMSDSSHNNTLPFQVKLRSSAGSKTAIKPEVQSDQQPNTSPFAVKLRSSGGKPSNVTEPPPKEEESELQKKLKSRRAN